MLHMCTVLDIVWPNSYYPFALSTLDTSDVSFLTSLKVDTPPSEDPTSPVPTLESVVSLVTASTTDANVAALAAVQDAADSANKGINKFVFTFRASIFNLPSLSMEVLCSQI